MLQMRGVTRRFGSVVALDKVDFDARAGEIHALLGENGAGKSTLMHLLSGLYRMQAGEIRLDGRPVRIDSPHAAAAHGIAMVHQHFTLVDAFTVAENLALAAGSEIEPSPEFPPPASSKPSAARWLLSFDPRVVAAPALAIARDLGWSLEPDAPVGQLPVGTRQRVEILKALQRKARLLIFDEPTAVLAPTEVEELFALLRRLRGEGRTLIFISHKLGEVMALCDRVTVLRRGRRVATLEIARTNPRELASLMVGEGRETLLLREQAAPRGGKAPHPIPSQRGRVGEGDALRRRAVGEPPRLLLDAVTVSGEGRPAVDAVSLTVRPGEILGLAGVDGNGQVELAEAIWGIRPVAAGRVLLDGVTIAAASRRPVASFLHRKMGWVPQDRHRTGLVLAMSVWENLVLIAHAWPEYRRGPLLRVRALKVLAERLVRDFDIRVASAEQPVATLSGGNQQKIVIARALFDEPHVLIAVNPTRGLDIGATGYVHEQLRRARDRGAAILLISTELDEVLALADRVGVLYAGRLTGVLPPDAPREEFGLLMGGKAPPGAKCA